MLGGILPQIFPGHCLHLSEPHFCVCSKGGWSSFCPQPLVGGQIRCGPGGSLHVTSAMGKASSLGDIQNVTLQVSAGRGLPWTVPPGSRGGQPGLACQELRDWGREGSAPPPPAGALQVHPVCAVPRAWGQHPPQDCPLSCCPRFWGAPIGQLPCPGSWPRLSLPSAALAGCLSPQEHINCLFCPWRGLSLCRAQRHPCPTLCSSSLLHLSFVCTAHSWHPVLPDRQVCPLPGHPTPKPRAACGKVCELKRPVPIIQEGKWRQERGRGGPLPGGSPSGRCNGLGPLQWGTCAAPLPTLACRSVLVASRE